MSNRLFNYNVALLNKECEQHYQQRTRSLKKRRAFTPAVITATIATSIALDAFQTASAAVLPEVTSTVESGAVAALDNTEATSHSSESDSTQIADNASELDDMIKTVLHDVTDNTVTTTPVNQTAEAEPLVEQVSITEVSIEEAPSVASDVAVSDDGSATESVGEGFFFEAAPFTPLMLGGLAFIPPLFIPNGGDEFTDISVEKLFLDDQRIEIPDFDEEEPLPMQFPPYSLVIHVSNLTDVVAENVVLHDDISLDGLVTGIDVFVDGMILGTDAEQDWLENGVLQLGDLGPMQEITVGVNFFSFDNEIADPLSDMCISDNSEDCQLVNTATVSTSTNETNLGNNTSSDSIHINDLFILG